MAYFIHMGRLAQQDGPQRCMLRVRSWSWLSELPHNHATKVGLYLSTLLS